MTRELTTSVGRQNISLRDGAAALFRRKGLVLLTFLTVLIGTVIVTLVLPDKYESRMKILVKNQRVDVAITPANAQSPSVLADGEVTENQINSEIELLTSKDLLTQVVKECAWPVRRDVFYERGVSRTNFSHAGSVRDLLRPTSPQPDH